MFLRNISNPCAETSSLNFGCRICACSTSILTVRTTDLVMAGGSLNCDTRWSSSAMRLAGMAASIEVHRIPKNAFRVDLFRMLWIRVRIINFLLRIEFGSKNAKGSRPISLSPSEIDCVILPNHLTLSQLNVRKSLMGRQHGSKSTQNVAAQAPPPVSNGVRIMKINM